MLEYTGRLRFFVQVLMDSGVEVSCGLTHIAGITASTKELINNTRKNIKKNIKKIESVTYWSRKGKVLSVLLWIS